MVILLPAEQSSRIAYERKKKTRSLFASRPLVFHDTVNRSLNDFEFFICQFIKRYVYLSADCMIFSLSPADRNIRQQRYGTWSLNHEITGSWGVSLYSQYLRYVTIPLIRLRTCLRNWYLSFCVFLL